MAGYVTLVIVKYINLPKSVAGLKPILIVPLLSVFITGALMVLVIGEPIKFLLDSLTAFLENLGNTNAAIMGLLIGMMVAFERQPGEEYEIRYTLVDVNEVCNKEKSFPNEWITRHGTDISEEFLSYVRPLIQGEVSRPMKDGLPLYCFRR